MTDEAKPMTAAFEDNRNMIVRYIRGYLIEHGRPPTTRELARGCWMSQSTARYQLRILARQGRIEHLPHVARGIRLLEGR
jgi:SOS-response transcriptional repressor LexA